MSRHCSRPLLFVACLLLAAAAQAANVEVQLLDRNGQPLADAVTFLESAAARAAVKPAPGIGLRRAFTGSVGGREVSQVAAHPQTRTPTDRP